MYRFSAKGEKEAEVLIYEDVGAGWFGGVTAAQFAKDLKDAGPVQTIHVRIASYGGDVVDGLAIYRLLAEHKARIVVHVDSVAASIASVIAMAGDEIIIAEAGSMMIHEAWTIAAGHASELRSVANQLEITSGQLADIYTARTKNPAAKVKAWMAETKWFYGKEAVDAGFADSVAANVQLAANASLWNSVMRGRIAQRMQIDRTDPPAPHSANDDVRAALKQQTDRIRSRRLEVVK